MFFSFATAASNKCLKNGSTKIVMDPKVSKSRSEKKPKLQKQLDENTEKMNVIKKQKML